MQQASQTCSGRNVDRYIARVHTTEHVLESLTEVEHMCPNRCRISVGVESTRAKTCQNTGASFPSLGEVTEYSVFKQKRFLERRERTKQLRGAGVHTPQDFSGALYTGCIVIFGKSTRLSNPNPPTHTNTTKHYRLS